MKFLSVALLLASFNSYANHALVFSSDDRCEKFQFGIDALNEQLPEDRQLVLDCESTEETALGGLITKNVDSTVSVTTTIPLCKTSVNMYSEIFDFENGIFIGYDMDGVHPLRILLEANGLIVRGVRYGTGTGSLGHEVHTLQFPYCN